jgi:hypothetical protein
MAADSILGSHTCFARLDDRFGLRAQTGRLVTGHSARRTLTQDQQSLLFLSVQCHPILHKGDIFPSQLMKDRFAEQ